MSIIDIVTIIVFSIGIVLVGLAFSRQGKDMKSFFAGGGSMPWYMSGLSLFMGFFSAGTFVVWGSIAYTQGWVSITIQWTMAMAGFIVGFFIAPRWHKTGVLTVAEYINKRLGVSVQKMYTYLFLFISLFLTASFLYPVAKILEVSTGFPLNLCIAVLGGLCILYVSVGGLWAVISTDILQFVILTASVIIVIPLSLEQIDGIQNLLSQAPASFFNIFNGEYTIGFIIAFGIYNTIFLGGNWAYVQRFTCVKTSVDAKKVGIFFGVLYIISPILWMLPPMVYRIFDSGLSPLEAEGAYLMMCKAVLPRGILGLMIGGMIFATTSALNSKLNISAGVLTNDIFKRLKPESSEKTLMSFARWSTVGFGILTILIAMLIPYMGGVVNMVISLAALTGVPLYLPVIWTLFSKRQTSFSTMSVTLISLFVNCIFKFITPLWGLELNRGEEMIFGVAFPILLLILFELYYIANKQVSNRYESYILWENENRGKLRNTSIEETVSAQKEAKFSMRIIGLGILITGAIIMMLGYFAETSKVLVVSTGLIFSILGALILRKGKTN